jgi:nitrite reductase/ring-hydroxylating ferredoxin subunit
MSHGATKTEDRELPSVWRVLENKTQEELEAWRVADQPNRPDPDARNLQDEFPFGWFGIHYSDELAVGEVVQVRYFGQDMALWRGEDGKPRLLDAYCPHYGANMAIGGRVKGNLLECPFHAWKMDGDGAVQDIPYAPIVPPVAQKKNCVRSWVVEEANGLIHVWYHPDGAGPMWPVKHVEEASDEAWADYRKFEWIVHTSLENMADNAIDFSHFKYVHGAVNVPDYKFSYEGIERKVIADLQLDTPRGPAPGRIDSLTHGPGQGFVRFSGLADTLLVSATTPIDRDKLHVRFAFTQPKAQAEGPLQGLAKALLKDLCKQLDQDKVILDFHRRMDPPLACKGDGPFGQNKRYYNQFYASRNPGPQAIAS